MSERIPSAIFCPSRSPRTPASKNVSRSLLAFAAAALLAVTATAQIATGTTGIDATGNAQSEMARCNNGTTQQSRETCITEVNNANAARRRGQLTTPGSSFSTNALARCDALDGEDKIACQARVAGYGNASGSVAGGGAITEIESVVMPAAPGPVQIRSQTPNDTIIVIPANKLPVQ